MVYAVVRAGGRQEKVEVGTILTVDRLKASASDTVSFVPVLHVDGDTILTAVLTQHDRLRRNEFSDAPRAGFCMMGACQDCWIATEDGDRLRACSTFIVPGMALVTGGASPGWPRLHQARCAPEPRGN